MTRVVAKILNHAEPGGDSNVIVIRNPEKRNALEQWGFQTHDDCVRSEGCREVEKEVFTS